MSVEVHAKIWSGPDLLGAVEDVASRLATAGWRATSFGSGTPTWYPSKVPVRFVFGDRMGTPENQAAALKAVANASGGAAGAWSDFTASFSSEVVGKSATDAADLGKRAATTVEKGALGIGVGFGVALAVVFVVAAAYLAARYKKG